MAGTTPQEKLQHEIARLKAENAELLAVCESLLAMPYTPSSSRGQAMINKAQAAIAKAKEVE